MLKTQPGFGGMAHQQPNTITLHSRDGRGWGRKCQESQHTTFMKWLLPQEPWKPLYIGEVDKKGGVRPKPGRAEMEIQAAPYDSSMLLL